jgi:hypothetical protein
VIGMVVGEDKRIEMPDTLSRERCSEHVRVATRVDQDRAPAVENQDRVALSDVEHHEARSRRQRRADRCRDHCGGQQGCDRDALAA